MGEGATDLLLLCLGGGCWACMREVSSPVSDRCSFDSFWGSRTEPDPFFISLAVLSTRCCESIVGGGTASRWERPPSRDRNERLNMLVTAVIDRSWVKAFILGIRGKLEPHGIDKRKSGAKEGKDRTVWTELSSLLVAALSSGLRERRNERKRTVRKTLKRKRGGKGGCRVDAQKRLTGSGRRYLNGLK